MIFTKRNHPIRIAIIFPDYIPPPRVFSKKTLANYPWAKLKAHNLKYEAVLEIDPKDKNHNY